MNYIVGIGEILWDMLPEGKQLGGAPANFAYHNFLLSLKIYCNYNQTARKAKFAYNNSFVFFEFIHFIIQN